MEFTVEVEFAREVSDVDALQLAVAFEAFDGVASVSDHGNLVMTAGVAAPDMAAAVKLALDAGRSLGWGGPIVLTVAEDDTLSTREGFVAGDTERVIDVVSVPQAAAVIGVTRQRVLQLISQSKLRATRVGYSWVIEGTDLDAFTSSRPTGPRLSATVRR